MGRLVGGIAGGVIRALGGMFGLITGGLFGAVGRILLPIALVAAVLWAVSTPGLVQRLGQLLSGGQAQMISTPVVITQIRSMSTLVTTAYESEVTVDVKKDPVFSFLPAERVLLRVEGTILAGIDLSQIDESDVMVSGGEVIVHIPPAYIVSKDLHSTQLVADEGVLPGIDPKILPAAEEKGRDELLLAACREGILDRAEQHAQTALADLLSKLGGLRTLRLVQDDPQPGQPTGCP